MKDLNQSSLTIMVLEFCDRHNISIPVEVAQQIRYSLEEAKLKYADLVNGFGTGDEKAELRTIIQNQWRVD